MEKPNSDLHCLEPMRVLGDDGIWRLAVCGTPVTVEDVFSFEAVYEDEDKTRPLEHIKTVCERPLPHVLTLAVVDLAARGIQLPEDL